MPSLTTFMDCFVLWGIPKPLTSWSCHDNDRRETIESGNPFDYIFVQSNLTSNVNTQCLAVLAVLSVLKCREWRLSLLSSCNISGTAATFKLGKICSTIVPVQVYCSLYLSFSTVFLSPYSYLIPSISTEFADVFLSPAKAGRRCQGEKGSILFFLL